MRVLIWLGFFLSLTLHADQFAFEFYNDYFARTDKHFTNGVCMSWMDSDGVNNELNTTSLYTHIMFNVINAIPYLDRQEYKNFTAGVSLSQIMLTPKDTTKKTVQYNDMPYAGYLALSLFEFKWDQKSFKEYRLDLGVIGKESGAGDLQYGFHKLLNEQRPQGWDTQLGTHYVANALYRYGEKSWTKQSADGDDMDWFNHAGVQIGNYVSDLFAGTMFRFGKNYTQNFNVHYPYLREEASFLHVDKPHKGFGWSLAAGLNVEALAYLYPFDAANKLGYQDTINPVNASAYLGTDLCYGAHKLTLMYQAQSSYLMKQKEVDIFGGLLYSYQF